MQYIFLFLLGFMTTNPISSFHLCFRPFFFRPAVLHHTTFLSSSSKQTNPNSHYERFLRNLNSRNLTLLDNYLLNGSSGNHGLKREIVPLEEETNSTFFDNMMSGTGEIPFCDEPEEEEEEDVPTIVIGFPIYAHPEEERARGDEETNSRPTVNMIPSKSARKAAATKKIKSENFEVIMESPYTFKDIGGYDTIKMELEQCIDTLVNHKKYAKYNVRTPKGIILEGPPGNGKTLIAKGFAGQAKTAFIALSGSQFQEKFVGVGASRVRELFELARKNSPCIIFIDEIDAVGRMRSSEGESSSSERDSTLNELLVGLDGFNSNEGIFLIGATNRADLLDPALVRPGRIDKRIFIGAPDEKTREAVLAIHIKGKPHDNSVTIKDLVEMTEGFSCAQIENILNEAMLMALRNNREVFTYNDVDHSVNRMIAGWQPNEHSFSNDLIDHIAIHEMGHAIVGILSKHHSSVTKVVINLFSPKSPGYTLFQGSTSNIYIREGLIEHLMILLGGRIAEEIFYGVSVTTGAINDFEEAYKLAEKMILYYGMGKNLIYPTQSEKYKEIIDNEVLELINSAYHRAEVIIKKSKDMILDCANILKHDKILKYDQLIEIMNRKYPELLNIKIM